MLKSQLCLHDFKFQAHLGVSSWEREIPQEIILNISIDYAKPPDSCFTDSEQGFLCYEELGRKITLWLSESTYKTIEYLTMGLWKKLAASVPPEILLVVTTTKPKPPISTPNAGTSFRVEGITEGWLVRQIADFSHNDLICAAK